MSIAKSFYRPFAALRRRMSDQRLRSKLFVVYLLVTFLPISFLVAYSYHTVKEQLTRQAVDNIGSTIDQINNNIQNRLSMYSQIATLIYMDEQMRNYLSYRYEKNDLHYLDAYDYINDTLYKMLAMNPNLKSISIYTENKTLHSDGFFIQYMDDFPERLRAETFAAEGNITSFLSRADDGERTVTLARSLNYLSLNFPYGILTMEISERELYSLIEKENQNKTILLADERGDIITSGLEDRGITNVSELDVSKTEFMVVTKALPNGWRTVVLLPYATLLGDARKASTNMLLISLACIAAAIVLIFFTSRLMTKRIETLLQFIRKVERGTFELPDRAMGGDEIGQLAIALKRMASTIQDLIQDVYKKELLRSEAEMTTLQAQIKPHFLYNALASISALAVKHKTPHVHRMADELARFYRISLNKGKKSVTLGDELKLTEHYVSIQKMRFQGMFRVHYALDESLFPYTTPKLIIQPFIENCINHAIWDDEAAINIVVSLAEDRNDVLIAVVDDGAGMPRETAERLSAFAEPSDEPPAGYGIYNVNRRIRLAYGERYGVELYSRPGIGTAARIRLPKTTRFL
ncbi:sensor histidine kinase [Paenibacillus sp.]|uniref:cache domain-containing sensor histidine kinase n=1 Tax=Paenibacillus sp. TaxID=58172 RepID=UPI00281216A1|nr:sensor histidine kinase [Paenibacillus sp.]